MSKSRLMNGFMSKGVVQGVVFLRNQCTDKTTPTVWSNKLVRGNGELVQDNLQGRQIMLDQ